MTWLAQLFLMLAALLFAGFGLASLFQPERIAGMVGIQPSTTAGRSEIRAVYGGLELGLGAFLVYCALDAQRLELGLLLVVLTYGAAAVGRMIGIALDRPVEAVTRRILVAEVAFAIVGLVLLLAV